MNAQQLDILIQSQRGFFNSGETRNVSFRLSALKKLHSAICQHEQNLVNALKQDLGKSEFESYETEIGMALNELSLHIRKLKSWAAPKTKPTPLMLFPAKSRIYSEPFGHVLIMAPWNYPFLLLFQPLIGAISAGNTVLLKTSDYVPTVASVMQQLIRETFPENYISLISGGKEENQLLFQQRFDYIFFTGSPFLGKLVMKAAAEHLTPVTLELGGKSPCIVSQHAKIDLAARRIVWGKFLNAGQTCIAPDYLLVHQSVKQTLLKKLQKEITRQFGQNPKESPDFPRIVNDGAFTRLKNLLNEGQIFCGGETDSSMKYIAPTIIDNVQPHHAIMQAEIFGPLLPVIEYSNLDEALKLINQKEKPLAFYIFSENNTEIRHILNSTSSGGGCINDVIIHIGNHHLPFGGVGNSGMGKYHGKLSFDTFSNQRSIVRSSTLIDLPVKYAPHANWKWGLIRRLLK